TVSCSFKVIVNDTQFPLIVCPANVTVNTDVGQCSATGVALGKPSSTNDNCGIASVTNNATSSFPLGTNTVVWTVRDIHGNTSTCNQKVIVVDNRPPQIACPGNITVCNAPGQCSSSVTYSVTASDNCSAQQAP